MIRIYIFLLISSLAISYIASVHSRSTVEAIFFDVGQGDSYAFQTNDSRIILIDGGPDWTSLYGLGRWLKYFKRDIDIIILTHSHSDHLSSLPEVIKRYRVKKIILPSRLTGAAAEELLKSLGSRTEIIQPEENICIDFNNDCYLCVYPPSKKFINSRDENDLSLATYFNCSGLAVLASGDAPSAREDELIETQNNLKTDILKISHHGSKYSSASGFLDSIDPQLAIISVGKNNPYQHPHQELIDRLNQGAINFWRTDINGSVKVYVNNGVIFYKKIGLQE